MINVRSIIIIALLVFDVFGAPKINENDSTGKRQGLWNEKDGNIEAYYKNGKLNGVYRTYSRKTGKLIGFGEYENENKVGSWYYFDNSSHLVTIESNIRINTLITRVRDDGKTIKPKYISYLKNYYPSGVIKEEGEALYDEDVEIDYYRTGQWKYFDKDGVLTRTNVF